MTYRIRDRARRDSTRVLEIGVDERFKAERGLLRVAVLRKNQGRARRNPKNHEGARVREHGV